MTVTAIARFVYLLKKYDSDIKVVSSLTDEYAFRYDTVVLDFDKTLLTATQALKSATTELLQHLKASALRLSSTTITSA